MDNLCIKLSYFFSSLVSEDVVLTAAHCVKYSQEILVQMGHSDADSGTFLHVKSVLIHPDYEIFALPGLQAIADIALLRLNPTGSNVYFERLRPKGGSFLPYPPFIIRFKGILHLSIQICIVQG